MKEQARRFLSTIHFGCQGQLELRIINPDRKSRRQIWPGSIQQAVAIALKQSADANVYLGVATRLDRSSGTKRNLSHYPGVWVDLDFKDFEGGEEEARAKLAAFSLQPTIMVHTGGGFHVYWLLEKPMAITTDSLPQLEKLNKAFAQALGGDHCHSLDHILRIPGTTNWPDEKKRKLGRVPAPVRLQVCDGPRYAIEQLQRALPHPDGSTHEGSSKAGKTDGDAAPVPTRFLELLKHNPKIQATWEGKRDDLPDTSRSGYDMSMAAQLALRGFSGGEIKTILPAMPSGRGAEGTVAYYDLTIGKARNVPQYGPIPAAYIADLFLLNGGYDSPDGLRLRWHRETWLRFNGKAYDPLPVHDFQAEVTAYVQASPARRKATKNFVNNILLNLEARCLIPSSYSLPVWETQRDWVESPATLVMTNGIVDLQRLFDGDDDVLQPHSPRLVSTIALPFAFDSDADCQQWLSFLEEILPDAESRDLLQEIFGYSLTYDTSQQKFFMFEGIGANGKGVVTGILTKMLGEANISTLPLEMFAASHGLEVTLGKLVNIISEIGDLDRVAEGYLKQFTGGDAMHFNPKYKHPFSAKPTAKLIISTNVRPPFRDRSEGIWRRLILLPFPISIPDAKQNKHLVEELTAELAGIFNWAAQGYIRLRQRGHFAEPAVSRKAKREFKLESNPARQFLQECCASNPTEVVPIEKVYQAYKEFCKTLGFNPLNDANFGKEVRRVFPQVRRVKLAKDLNEYRCPAYEGLVLLHAPSSSS